MKVIVGLVILSEGLGYNYRVIVADSEDTITMTCAFKTVSSQFGILMFNAYAGSYAGRQWYKIIPTFEVGLFIMNTASPAKGEWLQEWHKHSFSLAR